MDTVENDNGYVVEGVGKVTRNYFWFLRNIIDKADNVYSIDRSFKLLFTIINNAVPIRISSHPYFSFPSEANPTELVRVSGKFLTTMPWQETGTSELTYGERMNAALADKQELIEVLDAIKREPTVRKSYVFIEEAFGATPVEAAFVHRICLLGRMMRYEVFPALMRSVLMVENKDEAIGSLIGFPQEDIAHVRSGQLRELGLITFNDDATKPFTHEGNTEKVRIEIHPLLIKALETQHESADSLAAMLSGRLVEPDNTLTWDDFAHLGQLRDVAAAYLQSSKGGSVLLVGDPGTGKTQFASVLSRQVGTQMFSVGETHEGAEPTRNERFACLKTAVAVRRGSSTLLLDEAEDLLRAPEGASDRFKFSKAHLNRFLDTLDVPVIWTTNSVQGIDPATLRRMGMVIPFDAPGTEVRQRIWSRTLTREGLEGADAVALARDWKAPAGLCVTAARTAVKSGLGSSALEPVLDGFNRVINIRARPEGDAGNFDPRLCQCEEDLPTMTSKLANAASPRWSLCLWGPPGTGKSAFARHVAKQMGMEILLKRASDMMDMYVGNTEKKIAEAFAQARSERRMLIIDEADSMLGSREGARQSWEISQVNEMLTQMESHTYPFVATTNLMDKLDRASLRRFTFKLRFDHMSRERARLAFSHILQIELPDNLELPDDLAPGDIAPMLKRMEILGVQSAQTVVSWLREEIVLKGGARRNPMGFGG